MLKASYGSWLRLGLALVVALAGAQDTLSAAPPERAAEPFSPRIDRVQAEEGPAVRRPRVRAMGAGGVLEVDDDSVECPGAGFATIQAAVDAAASMPGSQKIHVCAGTYAENVSIGAGNSLILAGDGPGSTLVTGAAPTAGPIIDAVSAGRVDLRDLAVDGGSAMVGGVVWGIRYDDTGGRIDGVEVLNIRNASGSSQGIGIRVQSTTGARARVKVMRSLVRNYTRVGINGNGRGVDLKVERTDILGPALPRVWAPNGVQMSRGAEGRVHRNFVDNNPSPNVPGGAGSGIILFCPGPTWVTNNLVTRADLGISVVDTAGARVHNNDIADSGFDAISLQFLGLFFGNIGCTAPGAPLPVEDNSIHNNNIVDSGDTGISFANFDAATDPATPNDNRVSSNRIGASGFDGIHVFDGSSNLLLNNWMTGSGSTDAADDTSGGGTAGTANTWKNNKCSTSSPPGLCK